MTAAPQPTVEDASIYAGWMLGVALVDWCGSEWCATCDRNWLDVEAASLSYDLAIAEAHSKSKREQ